MGNGPEGATQVDVVKTEVNTVPRNDFKRLQMKERKNVA